jgi:hypothetical protein
MSNPYRVPAEVEKEYTRQCIEHAYIPEWVQGNYFMIRTASTNIANVKCGCIISNMNCE